MEASRLVVQQKIPVVVSMAAILRVRHVVTLVVMLPQAASVVQAVVTVPQVKNVVVSRDACLTVVYVVSLIGAMLGKRAVSGVVAVEKDQIPHLRLHLCRLQCQYLLPLR